MIQDRPPCLSAKRLGRKLSLYFEKKPPFGDGKKKSEFPDAISLLSSISNAIAGATKAVEQKEILKVVRQLADDGQIVLGGKGDDSFI